MNDQVVKEIISLIPSKDLREHFEKNNLDPGLKTLGALPISLEKKLDLAQRGEPNDYDAVPELQEALYDLNHMSGKECLILNLYRRQTAFNTNECVMCKSVFSWKYERAKRVMKNYLDLAQKETGPLHEPDWYWALNLIDISNRDRGFLLHYVFFCDPYGEPQYVADCRSDWPKQHGICYFSGNLFYNYSCPVLYKAGDILHINCSPYPPYDAWCVVMDVTSSRGPNTVECFYPIEDGKIALGTLGSGLCFFGSHFCQTHLALPLRAEIFTGEPPEKSLKELSHLLREFPADKFDSLKNDLLLNAIEYSSSGEQAGLDFPSEWSRTPWSWSSFNRSSGCSPEIDEKAIVSVPAENLINYLKHEIAIYKTL